MSVRIDPEKCKGCGVCVKACPQGAIQTGPGGTWIDQETCIGCGACIDQCAFEAIAAEGMEEKPVSEPDEASGIWVFVERAHSGRAAKASLEILCAGRKLADARKTELSAVVLTDEAGIADVKAQKLEHYGADRVIFLHNEWLKAYTTDAYCKALCDLIQARRPEIVLIAASHVGRDLAPRVAARLNTGLTADCTELQIEEETGLLLQTRPAFGGNIMATIINPNHRPQMATVRPGVMEMAQADETHTARIEIVEAALGRGDLRVTIEKSMEALRQSVDLTKAEIIVTAGRGMKNPKGIEMVKRLAEALGAEIGATRAVVEEGWLDQAHQVGQTGKTVRPKLYIACGVSGALQHLAGMSASKFIVAINTNPDAPIMKAANVAVCGNALEIVPMLCEAVLSEKAQ